MSRQFNFRKSGQKNTQSKNEQLKDLYSQRSGLISYRDSLVRTTNSRSRRRKLVHGHVENIRVLMRRLSYELQQIAYIRSCSSDSGAIHEEIDRLNQRIKELGGGIGLVRVQARLEQLLDFKRKMEQAEQELGGDPDQISEEQIVS